ncbi:MAG: response regulator transcription factor [Gallionellaceae bacterium]|jgi:DNA-binding NarL/FixJ family response regulator
MTPARIFLIDDHPMFRSGLRMLLAAGIPDIEISESVSLDAAMQDTQSSIDVVLLDINLKGINGIEGIALLKRKWPLARILMVSSQDDPKTVSMAISRGADGFISKTETADNIIASINQILLGQFSPALPKTISPAQRSLTPRQLDVLNLMHQGLSNKLMASQLSLSKHTVHRHVQAILDHFGATNRAEALFAARNQGLVN